MAAAPLVDFTGRHIAVIGAAGDIGTTIVALLLELGGRVTALDRDASALDRLAALPGAQGALATVPVDVADEAGMAAAFAGLGPIDGLVNGAAIEHRPAPTTEIDAELFRKVVDINITGVFLGLKFGLPLLRRPGGSVVNFGSTGGIKGANGMSAYVASKHAVIGLSRAAALETAPHGIRVNTLCPGPTSTRMMANIHAAVSSAGGDPSGFVTRIPAGRYGEAAEIATTAVFLLLDAPVFLTGAEIPVDGGMTTP